MPRLIGEKLVLREYTKEDLPHMREWVNDWEVTRLLSDVFLYPHTMNQTEAFLNLMLENKDETRSMFVLASKDSLEYIGQVSLFKIDWKNRIAELGIVISKKDCQGKGLGKEAIELLQYFAFNKLNLNKLELSVHDFNERAIKCYKKCGFAQEGRLRKKFYFDGKYSDSILMGILKDEYEARESKTRDFIFKRNGILGGNSNEISGKS